MTTDIKICARCGAPFGGHVPGWFRDQAGDDRHRCADNDVGAGTRWNPQSPRPNLRNLKTGAVPKDRNGAGLSPSLAPVRLELDTLIGPFKGRGFTGRSFACQASACS